MRARLCVCGFVFQTRPALIPSSVLNERNGMVGDDMDDERKLERDTELAYGGAGVYNPDYRMKHFTYVCEGQCGFALLFYKGCG